MSCLGPTFNTCMYFIATCILEVQPYNVHPSTSAGCLFLYPSHRYCWLSGKGRGGGQATPTAKSCLLSGREYLSVHVIMVSKSPYIHNSFVNHSKPVNVLTMTMENDL